MADKCYVHVDGTDWSFVCAPSSYASVDQLLDDTRRRYGARFPDAPALPGRLQALLGGVALANVRSIPSKADVMVCAAPEAPTSTPSDADALKRAGNTALVSGDLPAAVSHYTAALAATPAATPAAALLHCNRALAHLRLERWAEAEADAAQAVSGDAQNVKAHFRWAQALVAQGRHAEALPVLTSALDIACITNAQALEVGLMIAKCEEVVPSTSSAEDVSAAREARLPVAVYVRLKPFYEAAVESALAQRWAHAIGLYQKIIDINPADYTALLGLGTCLLRNKSHREADACTALATLCQHHGHDSFECWRLLGEAQCCAGRFDEALETLGKAANHLESGAADAEEVQLRTKEVKTWAARALSGQRKFDLALHFVSQVLSVDDTYVPALLAYGRLMIDYRAELDEALKVGLKCVTLAPKEREAKRLLCAVLGHPGMPERLLRALGPQLPASGYSYLGALAKEYSALPAAVMLFREALKREPSSASHALSLVHALEVHVDQEGALEALRAWLTSNREQLVRVPSTAACVSAAQLLEAWDDAAVPAIGWVESGHQLGKPVWATDADLDFLALAFALVKLLYLRGTLAPLPRLIGVVERVRCGWDFHLTTIRNEHAFYCCVAQCLASSFAPRAPDANADRLYVVGDSHCLPCAWQTLKARGDTTVVLEPRLVTGCKMWHLRPEGQFFPKHNFDRAMESVPVGSDVLVVLGEIDCREGLLICVEKGRYETLGQGIAVVVDIFVAALSDWVARKKLRRVLIHPVLPVLDPTRHIVETFNAVYRERVLRQSGVAWRWLSFYDALVEPRTSADADCASVWQLKSTYQLDGTHMHPRYVSEQLQRAVADALV